MVDYDVEYVMPRSAHTTDLEICFLERRGYNAIFSLEGDCLSGILKTDKELDSKTLKDMVDAPYTSLFELKNS
ncbi:hypothetical protein GOV13_04555 [Candidatus Pacearchaeota archaeon]|nr:hypothetical protein [Candidatus Pacearchaeota archaeon]